MLSIWLHPKFCCLVKSDKLLVSVYKFVFTHMKHDPFSLHSLWHLSKTMPLRVQYGILKTMYRTLCKTEGS